MNLAHQLSGFPQNVEKRRGEYAFAKAQFNTFGACSAGCGAASVTFYREGSFLESGIFTLITAYCMARMKWAYALAQSLKPRCFIEVLKTCKDIQINDFSGTVDEVAAKTLNHWRACNLLDQDLDWCFSMIPPGAASVTISIQNNIILNCDGQTGIVIDIN